MMLTVSKSRCSLPFLGFLSVSSKSLFSNNANLNYESNPAREDYSSIHDNPWYGHTRRKMQEPIKTGRKWHRLDWDKRPPTLRPQDVEDPFEDKALPMGTKIIFHNLAEHELAKGKYWIPGVCDRFSEWTDYDIIEKGWGGYELYNMLWVRRTFEDLTSEHNIYYHYRLNNLAIHVELARFIPHLKPLLPELRNDMKEIEKSWQDITKEVLENDDDVDITNDTQTYHEKSYNYQGKTVYKTRKVNSEIVRRRELSKDIKKITIKKYVDDCVEERDFIRLIFIDAIGTKHYIYGMIGETLLEACRRYNVPIDGYCSGMDRGHLRVYGYGPMCGQCQMDISPKYFKYIPPYDWREKQLSTKYRTITPYSRLGCCLWIRPEWDGMVISLPPTVPDPLPVIHEISGTADWKHVSQ